MKLKPKMLLSIGVPLLIVFVIMGVVIYQMASAGLRLATETSMQSMARQYATLVNAHVESQEAVLQTVALNWTEGLPDEATMQDVLNDLGGRSGVYSFYIGTPGGLNMSSAQRAPGYDSRVRPWYKSAAQSDACSSLTSIFPLRGESRC